MRYHLYEYQNWNSSFGESKGKLHAGFCEGSQTIEFKQRKIIMSSTRHFFVIFTFFYSLLIINVEAGIVEALQLRSEVEWSHTESFKSYVIDEQQSKVLKLRTTRGFDQRGSQNCWIFATLNMLETNFLEKNKSVDPQDSELSRWYINAGESSYYTRGVAVDAIYHYSLITGFVAINDEASSIVKETTYLSKKYTPKELRKKLLDGRDYWSYAFSNSKQGWHRHADSDALVGTKSYFVKKDRFHEIVKKSLEQGKALTYFYDGHLIELYGAEFDATGKALKYYMKDSYPGYFYVADADKIASKAKGVTTIANIIK